MIGYDRPIDDIHNNLITCNPICVYGMLRKIRILFAGVIGAMITFYFLDMAGLTAGWPNWARLQFVPALLSGSFCIDCFAFGDCAVWTDLLFSYLPVGDLSGCSSLGG